MVFGLFKTDNAYLKSNNLPAPKICHNGFFYHETDPVLQVSNKSYRYGDGFFETIKVLKGVILLKTYHRKRIEKSLALLQYHLPESSGVNTIFSQILELCKENGCNDAARVRLSFSNGNGGLFDNNGPVHYIIEAWPIGPAEPLEPLNSNFNESGLIVSFFSAIKKSCDAYANLKSASALLYTVAAGFCKQQKWDDCIILNQYGNCCESAIANLFWIKEGQVFTPALTEGCVDGVMRAYLIDQLPGITETSCKPDDLLQADELFLTNAIRGIRRVSRLEQI